jgi:hypothetical protein
MGSGVRRTFQVSVGVWRMGDRAMNGVERTGLTLDSCKYGATY